ncbi:unnamed protein product, partial [Oppiella nova]
MIDVKYSLCSVVLQCAVNEGELCGANGLPVTPASIAMIGHFKAFIDSHHHFHDNPFNQYLTQYLDCIRNKKGLSQSPPKALSPSPALSTAVIPKKLTLIFEHYLNALPVEDMDLLATNSLLALYHMHYNMGCVHGLVTPDALVFDGRTVKVTHWAINAITNGGKHCDANMIVPDDTRFLPYEQLYGITVCKKSDVWSLALTLLAIIEPNIKLSDNPSDIVSCLNSKEVLIKVEANITKFPEKWQKFFLSALQPKPAARATVKELLKILEIPVPEVDYQQLNELLRYPKLDTNYGSKELITIHEIYHLYCLAFPATRDQSQEKLHKKPPIFTLPTLVLRDDKSTSGETVKQKSFLKIPANNELQLLPIDKLIERLNQLSPHLFCPLILTPGFNAVYNSPNLPIGIRENDFDYQCERIMIFRRLIEGAPFTRTQLLSCAKVDIPPLYRPQTWAHILNIKWSD